MTKYYASVPGKNHGDDARVLIIGGEVNSFDAKQYAMRVLGTDGLLFQETGPEAKPDVELQFVGDDYNGGGTLDAKRLQIRKRTKTGWSAWKDLK